MQKTRCSEGQSTRINQERTSGARQAGQLATLSMGPRHESRQLGQWSTSMVHVACFVRPIASARSFAGACDDGTSNSGTA